MSRRYYYRNQHGWAALLTVLLCIALYFLQQSDWLTKAGMTTQTHQPGLYQVTRFVDGDTIQVSMGGSSEKIRFIGIDTPETHKPNTPVQCYGPAAAAFTKNIIGNQRVRLESDSLSTNRDRYGRLLRYVYLPNGTLVNQQIIEQGYGFYYPYFPFTKSDQFAAAQEGARTAGKGLWSNCTPTPTDKGGWVSNNQG